MELSLASLPWFLTQFNSSMDLKHAVRVLDCFFYDGVKVLLFSSLGFDIVLPVLQTETCPPPFSGVVGSRSQALFQLGLAVL